MKVLTVRQPWAWAIIHAGKDIENRSWNSRYRGVIAIHAGLRIDSKAVLPHGSKKPGLDDLVTGAIIGVVEIVDVVDRHRSKWYEGEFGFVLAAPWPLQDPIPCKGSLGLWNAPPSLSRRVKAQLPRMILSKIGE